MPKSIVWALPILLSLLFVDHCYAQTSLSQSGADAAALARLCRRDDSTQPTILIGRFLVADHLARKQLPEKDLAYVIAGALRSRQIIVPFVWERDARDARSPGAATWINDIFLQGAAEDKLTSRISRDLAVFLRDNDCDYLIGGHVTSDGPLVTLAPYLLDARQTSTYDPKVTRPFDPILQAEPISANRLGELFGAKLSAFLVQSAGPNEILVGCFRFADTDRGGRKGGDLLLLAQETVSGELARKVRTGIKITQVKPPCREEPGELDDGKRTAKVVGEIAVRSGLTELKTLIQLLAPRNSGTGDARIEFRASAPSAAFLEMVKQQTDRVTDFFAAVTRPDGSWPARPLETPNSANDPIMSVQSLIAQGDKEAAALAAYAIYSRQPTDAATNLALGRALMSKGLYSTAMVPLNLALEGRSRLNGSHQGLLLESLGESLATSGSNQAALKYLEEAQTKYTVENDKAGLSRSTRLAALLLVKTNNLIGAKAQLLRMPDLKQDADSLFLLFQVELASGNLSEAVTWLIEAASLNPKDERIASSAATLFGFQGDRALEAKNYSMALEFFQQSLQYSENSRVRYLAGYAAAEMGDLKDAVSHYLTAIRSPAGDSPARWVEASWLGLLENYLLLKNFSDLDMFGKEASERALSRTAESRLLALYMRLVGKVFQGSFLSVQQMQEDEVFKDIETMRRASSLSRTTWNNASVERFMQQTDSAAPEQLALLQNLTASLFPKDSTDAGK